MVKIRNKILISNENIENDEFFVAKSLKDSLKYIKM